MKTWTTNSKWKINQLTRWKNNNIKWKIINHLIALAFLFSSSEVSILEFVANLSNRAFFFAASSATVSFLSPNLKHGRKRGLKTSLTKFTISVWKKMSTKSKHLSARAFLFCSSGSPTFFGPLNVDPVPNLTMRFPSNFFKKNKTESENKKIGLNNWKQGRPELKNNDHNVLSIHNPPETAVFYHNMKKQNWNGIRHQFGLCLNH